MSCKMHALTLTYLPLLLSVSAAPNYSLDLYEGSSCRMEDGSDGKCIKILKCPTRLREVQRRSSNSSGRCGFDSFVEIVCCPLPEVDDMITPMVYTTTTSRPIMRYSTSSLPIIRSETTSMPVWTIPALIDTTNEVISTINDIDNKLGLRPADAACQQFEKKVTGSKYEQVNPWIIGGENASKGEFPHMVALGYKENLDSIRYNCGGTLITVRHVLTAAHCVSNINNYVPTEVKLGAINLNDNSNNVQNIKVSEIIAHPRYKRSLNYYDIAILKLERSAVTTQFVKPVCLQTKPLPNLANLVNSQSLVVTGWGATSFDTENYSNTLQKTPTMQLVDRFECSKFYTNFSKLPQGIDDSMICLLDKNVTRRSDACQGDSGGPLLYGTGTTSTVVGITSFGQSCGSAIPAIYTNVFFHLDWIEEIVWPDIKRALRRT